MILSAYHNAKYPPIFKFCARDAGITSAPPLTIPFAFPKFKSSVKNRK